MMSHIILPNHSLGWRTLFILLLLSFHASANSNKIALIIGNSNYQHIQNLKNPVNDATDLTHTFKQLGFDVTSHYDLNRKKMHHALQQFELKAAQAELAIIYFAGHGIQLAGANYLLPTDINASHPDDISSKSLSLHNMLTKITRSKLAIAIIDACRDNPFKNQSNLYRSLFNPTETRGLSRTKTTSNIAIFYSAAPGQKAQDGQGRNSIFVQQLKQSLDGNLEFDDIVRQVGLTVLTLTQGEQQPFIEKSATFPRLFLKEPNTEVHTVLEKPTKNAKPFNPPRLVNDTFGSLWQFLINKIMTTPFDNAQASNHNNLKPALERIAFGDQGQSISDIIIESKILNWIRNNPQLTGHEILSPIDCQAEDPRFTIMAQRLSKKLNILLANLFTIHQEHYNMTLHCDLNTNHVNTMNNSDISDFTFTIATKQDQTEL